jgi:hypothetical protein
MALLCRRHQSSNRLTGYVIRQAFNTRGLAPGGNPIGQGLDNFPLNFIYRQVRPATGALPDTDRRIDAGVVKIPEISQWCFMSAFCTFHIFLLSNFICPETAVMSA